MDMHEKLQNAGLTGNEAKVYLELLKKGESSANQLAKNLGIDRTLTYTILNHLSEKGQINHIMKENKKYFSCSAPENLLNSIKSKEFLIIDLIKELKSIEKKDHIQTEIKVYEGKEGLRVMNKLLMQEKDFCSFGSTGRAFFELYEIPHVAKEVIKKKIKVRILGNKKYKGTQPFNFKEFEYRYINIDSEATTSIFGEYVSIHLIKDKPLIIMIKNKEIAHSYMNHFNFLWKNAKK